MPLLLLLFLAMPCQCKLQSCPNFPLPSEQSIDLHDRLQQRCNAIPGQQNTEDWAYRREGHITASVAHPAWQASAYSSSTTRAAEICRLNDNNRAAASPACRYGHTHMPACAACYVAAVREGVDAQEYHGSLTMADMAEWQEHVMALHLHDPYYRADCNISIAYSRKASFLGSSPDAVCCGNNKSLILAEFKCPFTEDNQKLSAAEYLFGSGKSSRKDNYVWQLLHRAFCMDIQTIDFVR